MKVFITVTLIEFKDLTDLEQEKENEKLDNIIDGVKEMLIDGTLFQLKITNLPPLRRRVNIER